MSSSERRQLVVTPLSVSHSEIGRTLWMLEDARNRTAAHLEAVDPAAIDWVSERSRHTIGTLLYHVAAIEADWLYSEVLEQPFPAEIEALLTYDIRDEAGRLTIVKGESLDQLYQRLDTVRRALLASFRSMSLEDFRRARTLPAYDVSPEWVLHHLSQHEAEHRSEIVELLNQFRAQSEA